MENDDETSGMDFDRLLPVRHPQQDLFICDVADAILKDIMPEMEHPFYSLSKKPERVVREYHNGENWIRISPGEAGLATIYDKDILIYCISQVMAKLNRGEAVDRRIRMSAREFLIFTNRGTSGRDYIALVESLERLRGTTITTNIKTGGEEQTSVFGLIDAGSVRRKVGTDGRMLWVELTLSDWVFNAIRQKEVLTLHKDYFRLRKPLERRVYEIGRKFCGKSLTKKISLEKLLNKTGAKSAKKKFRFNLNEMAKSDHLPDYRVHVDEDDFVHFTNKGTMFDDEPQLFNAPLTGDVYEKAREAAPGWDIRYIEQEWRTWVTSKGEGVKSPNAAFLGFCRKWFKDRGRP